MASIIVRNIDDTTHARLKREADTRGISVNTLMQHFIRNGLKPRERRPHDGPYRDLDGLAGRWTAHDEAEFVAGVAPMAEVDPALWR